MPDRHWFGDLALAVLLVLPLAGLAKSQPISHRATASSPAVGVTSADRSPAGRVSLLG